MAETAPSGTLVTRIPRASSDIDNTRPGWPNSSFVPVFNRNGGPAAAATLDGNIVDTAGFPDAAIDREQKAELIGQGDLCLGDALQRRVGPVESARIAEDPVTGPVESESSGAPEKALGSPPRRIPPAAAASEPEVVTEVRRRKPRGGRPAAKEKYPFGRLPISTVVNGCLEGVSFLIPHDDQPRRRIAAGRKRHKADGKRFLTASEDDGVRVWRGR